MPGLFSPVTVRRLRLKNRLVMPPMANQMATPEGAVSDRHISHYTARARAGVGLIVVEHAYVRREGRLRPTQLGVYDDDLIPGLRRLAAEVHLAGAAIGCQINHGGAKSSAAVTGEQPGGPSDVPPPGASEQPRPLTREEIREIVVAFGQAARRAAEAGFDVVEVHGAHGYLLSQFLSPLTNRRADEYGGDETRRQRLPLEVLGEARRVLGSDFPIFYRFGADDLVEGGIGPEDARRVAPALAAAGADVLDVSGGLGGSGADRFAEQGFFVPLAHSLKSASDALVVGIGNIREPEYADRVIREGLVDLVAVGRAQLEDADWAAKAALRLAGG